MTNEYLMVGVIVRTKGFKGELVLTEVPKAIDSVAKDIQVKIGYSEQFSKTYTLTNFKRYQKGANIKLKEIMNDDQGKELKEHGLFVSKENINRKENVYIDHELAGCKVFDNESGEELGIIVDIYELPANDVWVMESNGKEVPLPVIDDVIISVDIDKKEIRIKLLDGLMELGE